jgi:hypothetical protein
MESSVHFREQLKCILLNTCGRDKRENGLHIQKETKQIFLSKKFILKNYGFENN